MLLPGTCNGSPDFRPKIAPRTEPLNQRVILPLVFQTVPRKPGTTEKSAEGQKLETTPQAPPVLRADLVDEIKAAKEGLTIDP
jgi:hypothetical protein